MNNFEEDYLLSHTFARNFGLTETELLETFDKLDLPKEQHLAKLKEAQHWYNRYQFEPMLARFCQAARGFLDFPDVCRL